MYYRILIICICHCIALYCTAIYLIHVVICILCISPCTVHAGAVSVGGVVGAIISVLTTIVVTITITVALVIARKRKAKECGAVDLKAAVSVDKYNMRILVYCTVKFYAVWHWFILIHKT